MSAKQTKAIKKKSKKPLAAWSVERANRVIKLYDQGYNVAMICSTLEISKRTVYRLLKRGISTHHQVKPSQCPEIDELMAQGWTREALAKELGVSSSYIRDLRHGKCLNSTTGRITINKIKDLLIAKKRKKSLQPDGIDQALITLAKTEYNTFYERYKAGKMTYQDLVSAMEMERAAKIERQLKALLSSLMDFIPSLPLVAENNPTQFKQLKDSIKLFTQKLKAL